jgi:type VI protein secretion system component VasK
MVGATFLDFLWSLIIIFFMVAFFMILFQVIGDLFRRDDVSGFGKVLWILFMVFFIFFGVFIYLIVNGNGMRERQMAAMKESQQQFDSYVQTVAGGSADQIAKAKELLDAGTISQEEFDAIKAKALA